MLMWTPAAAPKGLSHMTTHVVMIDDHEIIRLGIQQILSQIPDVICAGGYASVKAFTRKAGRAPIDIVLLSDTLHGIDTFTAVSLVENTYPDAVIILLCSQTFAANIQLLLERGVLGFIHKHEPLRDTLEVGIQRVLAGKIHFSPEMALVRLPLDTPTVLSPRLCQVLRLIAQGYYIQDIAHELGISTRAVYAARARLREALGVQTDAQLGAEAMRRGLLDGECE